MNAIKQLGHYRIEAHLGEGQFTHTYRAVDRVRKRVVALILLKDAGLALAPYLEQSQPAGDLVHPHLAWVWESGQIGDDYYLTERYVDGPSLAQMLVEYGPLPWGVAVKTIGGVAQGLDFAHEKGWMHADIKPGNILLNQELGAVLGGFGLSITRQARQARAGKNYVFTPNYTAPEIWHGAQPSPQSDQYALACVFYEIISGGPLFTAPSEPLLEASHLTGWVMPDAWPPGVPKDIVQVLKVALSKEPTERYKDVGTFARSLAALPVEDDENSSVAEQHAQWVSQRRAAQEQEQLEAAEQQRQAALEEARREIEARLESVSVVIEDPPVAIEKPVVEQPEQPSKTSATGLEDRLHPPPGDSQAEIPAVSQTAPTHRRTGRRERRARKFFWPVWAILAVILIALSGFWLDSILSGVGLFPPTATATQPPPSATLPPTASQTATSTDTLTPTMTEAPSVTPTQTSTATDTLTPEPTGTPTSTSTPTWTLTPTKTPKTIDIIDNEPVFKRPTRD